MLDENKAIARRYYEELWSNGKLDGIAQIVSRDCQFHDPVYPDLGLGTESLRNHINNVRAAFPDLRFTIDDMIAEKDEVVVHWTARGNHQGQFLGLPPTNRTGTVTGTSILRFSSGKVVEQWSDWNLLTLLENLGVMISPQLQTSSSRKAVGR
jgi:steroid delta-isomerase-like uncharacterized protein